MAEIKVLFICRHNSARSQMAEAFLNELGKGEFIVESAGLEPGSLNPLVVEVMQEAGIDISGKETNDVFTFFKEGRIYHHVITVCDEASAEECPVFPGIANQLHWSFKDPSQFEGTREEKLQQTRQVRDAIRAQVEAFIEEVN